jgi:hypothetical protein
MSGTTLRILHATVPLVALTGGCTTRFKRVRVICNGASGSNLPAVMPRIKLYNSSLVQIGSTAIDGSGSIGAFQTRHEIVLDLNPTVLSVSNYTAPYPASFSSPAVTPANADAYTLEINSPSGANTAQFQVWGAVVEVVNDIFELIP